MGEDAEGRQSGLTPPPWGLCTLRLSLGLPGSSVDSVSRPPPDRADIFPDSGTRGLRGYHQAGARASLLSFLSLFFPFPCCFSFFAALLLSLSPWPPAPRPPLPPAHARPGTRSAHRTPFPRRGKGHSPRSEWGGPGLTGAAAGWAPPARGGAKVSGGGGVGQVGPLARGGRRARRAGAPRWVPGQGEVARGAPCPGLGAGCSPVTPPAMGTRGRGPSAHGPWQV